MFIFHTPSTENTSWTPCRNDQLQYNRYVWDQHHTKTSLRQQMQYYVILVCSQTGCWRRSEVVDSCSEASSLDALIFQVNPSAVESLSALNSWPGCLQSTRLLLGILHYEAWTLMRPTKLGAHWSETFSPSHLLSHRWQMTEWQSRKKESLHPGTVASRESLLLLYCTQDGSAAEDARCERCH